MSVVPSGMWQSYANRMADDLVAAGDVQDVGWAEAFSITPRHHFMIADHVLVGTAGGGRRCERPPVDLVGMSGWLTRIYHRSRAVVTDMSEADSWGQRLVTTESPPPAVAARTLHALDLRRGMRVLELGSGTGHMTALLVRRVGDIAIRSVEIDPLVRDRAERLLAELGMHPELASCDAERITLDDQGFDRIVVGFTTANVPTSWTGQLRPGGLLVMRIGWPLGGARHVALRRPVTPPDGVLHGRFTDWPGPLPAYRPPAGPILRRLHPYLDNGRIRSGSTFVNPTLLAGDTPLTPLAQAHLGPGATRRVRLDGDSSAATFLHAPDGSWAEISHRVDRSGRHDVRHGGPTALVPALEKAAEEYASLGRPGWDEFGLTVHDGLRRLWHVDPTSGPSWLLASSGDRWWRT